jgi:hypothetical protein
VIPDSCEDTGAIPRRQLPRHAHGKVDAVPFRGLVGVALAIASALLCPHSKRAAFHGIDVKHAFLILNRRQDRQITPTAFIFFVVNK